MQHTVTPFINWGIWFAECPANGCPNIEHYSGGRYKWGPPAHQPPPHQCGLTDSEFRCHDCGTVATVDWPLEAGEVLVVLGRRPVPATRNWRPGEAVAELVVQNLLHGVEAVI